MSCPLHGERWCTCKLFNYHHEREQARAEGRKLAGEIFGKENSMIESKATEPMTGTEILKQLEAGKTQMDVIVTLERKVLMASSIILSLQDFFVNHLATKTKGCENASEVELCVLAGWARAWLMDLR